MDKDFQVHEFIEDYPPQEDEDIQWKITERKEFYELSTTSATSSSSGGGSNEGDKPQKVGRFFNHGERRRAKNCEE